MTFEKLRNWLTWVVCNFMLNHVATDEYGNKIELLIRQGQFHSQLGGPYITSTDAHEPGPEERDLE